MLVDCAKIALGPALSMLLGSCLVYLWAPGRVLLACLQCFGAGIILGAIGMELLPHLGQVHGGFGGTVCITVGFFVGSGSMFLIKAMCERTETDREEGSDSETTRLTSAPSGKQDETVAPKSGSSFPWGRSQSLVTQACRELKRNSTKNLRKPLPWPLITAVALDSFVDGFFLGMSYTASARAGIIMAVATAIEMGFLGLTFSATVINCGLNRRTVGIVTAMPCIMMIGSIVGGVLGEAAENYPSFYASFLSFGVAALIFLVTQELLLEANERQSDEWIPWINSWPHAPWPRFRSEPVTARPSPLICLFVGFWGILVIERTVG